MEVEVVQKWLNTEHLSTKAAIKWNYRQASNTSRTKSQHLKDSRPVLRLSLSNPLKPDVKSRMKM